MRCATAREVAELELNCGRCGCRLMRADADLQNARTVDCEDCQQVVREPRSLSSGVPSPRLALRASLEFPACSKSTPEKDCEQGRSAAI